MQGLMMKQGTYDLNKSRLEQLDNQVAFLDVAKNSDQEYLNRRLTEAEDVIKASVRNGDLSNNYLVDQLTAKIEQVVDEPILNAVVSTATRKKEEAQWKEAMEKNDGSYSDVNHSVMSRNWNKYVSDDRIGVKYSGGGGFTPFVDIDKMYASKEFNDYLKGSGLNTEYIVGSDGVGGFRAVDKYEGTADPNRLRQAIQSYVGDAGKKQLQINSVYKYGYGDTPESVDALRNDYSNRINSYLDNANSRLEAINIKLSSSTNPEEKEIYTEEKRNLEDEISNTQAQSFDRDVVGQDGFIDENKFSQIANNVYSNDKMDQLFNLTYMKPVWKDRELDAVQTKYVEFQEQKRQFELGYDLRSQQLDINRGNLELGMAKAGLTRDEAGNLVPMNTTTGGQSLNLANVMVGEGSVITEEEAGTQDISREMRMEYQSAIDGIYKSSGGNWSESATAKLESILATQDFYMGQEFNLGDGRKLKVTKDNIGYVQTLSDISKGQNTTTALLSNRLVKSVGFDDKGVVDWKKARVVTNSPNVYFVKAEDGKSFVAKPGKMPSAKQSNLSFLATKIDTKGWDALTDEEKMTANFYKTKIASADLELSKDERYLLNRAFNRRMGGNIQSLKGAISQVNKEDFNKNLKNNEVGILSTLALAESVSPVIGKMARERLAEEVKATTESKNMEDFFFSKTNLINNNAKEGYESGKEATINVSRGLMNRDQVVLTPPVTSKQATKDPENILYNSLRTRLGIENNYKGDIILQRVIKKGKPTDEFTVQLDRKDEDGNVQRVNQESVIVKERDLLSRGIQIATPEKTPFNAELGEFAATTNIIPSKSFISPLSGTNLKINKGTPQYYSERVNSSLNSWQDQIRKISGDNNFNIYNLTQSQPNIFVNPKIVVRPEGGEYYMSLDLGNDQYMPFGESLGKNVSSDRITTLKENGDDNILGAMRTYISHLTNTPLQ